MAEVQYVVPVGYHFLPTDIQLISYFLHKKINGEPFQAYEEGKILERSIYGKDANPWNVLKEDDPAWVDVVGNPTKKIIFVFSKQTLTKTGGQRVSRIAGCGTWEGKAISHAIRNNNGVVIGQMRQFSFKPKKGFKKEAEGKGHWIMHEYSIEQGNYVVCRIIKDMSKGLNNSDSSTSVVIGPNSDQEVIGTSSSMIITYNGNKRNFSEVINIDDNGDHGISALLINETEESSKKRKEIISLDQEQVLGNTIPNDYGGGVGGGGSDDEQMMMMTSNAPWMNMSNGGYDVCEASASASAVDIPGVEYDQNQQQHQAEKEVMILPNNNNYSTDLQIIDQKEAQGVPFDDLLDLSQLMDDGLFNGDVGAVANYNYDQINDGRPMVMMEEQPQYQFPSNHNFVDVRNFIPSSPLYHDRDDHLNMYGHDGRMMTDEQSQDTNHPWNTSSSMAHNAGINRQQQPLVFIPTPP